jgi:hypothetical protein
MARSVCRERAGVLVFSVRVGHLLSVSHYERMPPMGCWGVRPYESDSAADWFGDLWDEFPVPSKVEETLKLELEDSHEEIRAAAHVLVQLGQTYIWPVDSIDRHCDLAARRLEEIKAMEEYSGDDFQAQLQKEIEILLSRISKDFRRD